MVSQKPLLSSLTPRQREVLDLVARGFTNAAIAETLVLTEKSVENYVSAIYQRLGVDLRDPLVNPRVMATLTYLGESNVSPRQLWQQRYRQDRRAEAGPEGGDELSDDDLRWAVGGVDWMGQLLALVTRAHPGTG